MMEVMAAMVVGARLAAEWRPVGWSASVWTLMMMLTALTYFPVTECAVLCNEYDTCFPMEYQMNISDAIREKNNKHICSVATLALNCLDEAREDCDNGYKNLPEFIIHGLEEKRKNLTTYTTYCGEKTTPSIQQVKQGSNGGNDLKTNIAMVVLWTLLLTLRLAS